MKTRFLCSNHLAWLENRPDLAMVTSLQCSDKAQILWEEGECTHALAFAGSGFEAAQIVLKKHSGSVSERVNLYTASCVLFANILYSAQQPVMARTVIAAAIADLEDLMVLNEARREILHGCRSLLSLGDSASDPLDISDWKPFNSTGTALLLLH